MLGEVSPRRRRLLAGCRVGSEQALPLLSAVDRVTWVPGRAEAEQWRWERKPSSVRVPAQALDGTLGWAVPGASS